MKFSIITLVLAVSLIQLSDAYYGLYGAYGGYGGYGVYGGYGGYGSYGLAYGYGKRDIDSNHFVGYKSRDYMTVSKRNIYRSIPEELKNRTECVYTKESSILSCHGPSGVKECSVELKWDKPVIFQLFGLALPIETTEVLSEMKYRIFPRKLDNTAWIKEIIGKDISLYHSEKYSDYGLLVKEKTCFEELVTILKSSVRKELVELEDIKEKVTLIGDLLLADKFPKLLTDDLTFQRTTRDMTVEKKTTFYEKKLAELKEDKVQIETIIKREIVKSETTTKLIREDIKLTNDKIRRVIDELTHLTHDEHTHRNIDDLTDQFSRLSLSKRIADDDTDAANRFWGKRQNMEYPYGKQ